jgi:arylformamidase
MHYSFRQQISRSVRFGPTVEETVDIFPAAEPDAAILVFIHGGYWRRLSSKEFSFVARGPVALGITVVITNYALCPKDHPAESFGYCLAL